MKVQHTFDLSDDEMIAIGVDMSGTLRPCTRAEAKIWFDMHGHSILASKTERVREIREELTGHVLESLANDE